MTIAPRTESFRPLQQMIGATTGPVRGARERDRSLIDGLTHIFSLRSFAADLRSHAEYERNGHAGRLLLKTPELRVVLEAMLPDTVLGTHIAHGPTTLFVLEGGLDVRTAHGTFHVGESHMVTLPHEERREIRSPVESLFVLALGHLAHAEDRRPPAAVTHPPRPRRRILIVASRTGGCERLVEAARARLAAGDCEFVVLASAAAGWISGGEEPALDRAREQLDATCARLRQLGAPVRGAVGDFYPVRAIQDLLLVEDHGFDEILLSTSHEAASEWETPDLSARIERRFGITVSRLGVEG